MRDRKDQSYRWQYRWQRIGMLLLALYWLSGCGKADKALPVPALSVPALSEATQPTSARSMQSVPAVTDESISAAEQSMIYVYVCGAVQAPKVVELPAESRAWDALEAAGGFAAEADRNAVNLAEPLTDGQKLYFPTEEERKLTGSDQASSDGRININTADAAQLCTLPGIGTSRAEAIIAYRKQNGAFATVEDIMKVSGIKEGAFEKIKDRITVK